LGGSIDSASSFDLSQFNRQPLCRPEMRQIFHDPFDETTAQL
jgi:hypothetical protein